MERNTPSFITSLKGKRKIVAITAYDYPSAFYAQAAGVDIILVGDSLGMVIKGEENTLGVTLEEMVYHTRAVARAKGNALVVADMPFLSYSTPRQAVESAGHLIRAGAGAVKMEGPRLETIRALVQEGIPVMGHVGLTPQHYLRLGFKTQGKRWKSALRILKEARGIEEAGAFSVVLESIPMAVAKEITEALSIPTIGIGAGPHCDGQILVLHDILGLYPGKKPSFARQYAHLGTAMKEAVEAYARDVLSGGYPSEEESFSMKPEEYEKFREAKDGSDKKDI